MMRPIDWFKQKGKKPPMGTTPRSVRESIRVICGIMTSESLQVLPDGGPLNNDIFEEKAYGEGSGLADYCY